MALEKRLVRSAAYYAAVYSVEVVAFLSSGPLKRSLKKSLSVSLFGVGHEVPSEADAH